MEEIWKQLELLRATERRVAMATLVATRGTTPKKEGAKMWVGEGGRIVGSVTIGGCVDARVLELADEILASGTRRRLAMSLSDEEAWDFGMTCGGTVEVLIEPVRLEGDDDPVVEAYERIHEIVDAGRWAVAVTRLDGAGSRLVILDDGTRTGTLGSEALDEAAQRQAEELLARGDTRADVVNAAGESVEAFFEIHGPPATLVVFGGSVVAGPLITLAGNVGFRTIVVDARPRFASPERFPDADEIHVGSPGDIAAGLPLGRACSVVLLAHDYKYDLPVLREVLRHDVPYIGLLGSRKRGAAILDFLRGEGVAEDQIRRIRVPVGLNIGARTAAEIAVSILAEMLAVRSGRNGASLREGTPG